MSYVRGYVGKGSHLHKNDKIETFPSEQSIAYVSSVNCFCLLCLKERKLFPQPPKAMVEAKTWASHAT